MSAAAAVQMSMNLGWVRIVLLIDCRTLKFLLLNIRDTLWWSNSSVRISTDISHLEMNCINESDIIKKSKRDLFGNSFLGL